MADGEVIAAHYLAGMVGLAMLRRWYEDPAWNVARMAELRSILDGVDEFPYSLRLSPIERSLLDGYAEWAPQYDGPNPLIEAEEIVVQPILREVVGGSRVAALDAACGTGRHAAFLSSLGCDVVGVDQSARMLDVARSKLPSARFEEGALTALPFDDAVFDLAVCSLALCHLPDPAPALAELGRVLRPGGRLVVTDPHPMSAIAGGQAFYGGISADAPMRYVRNHYHEASVWWRGFRAAGLTVEECLEPAMSEAQLASLPAAVLLPAASRAASQGMAGFWVWMARADS
jgi:SAM-dependent methyltransferase